MRLLAGGRRVRTAVAGLLLVAGVGAILVGIVWAILGGLR
jgi:hypothetical protein